MNCQHIVSRKAQNSNQKEQNDNAKKNGKIIAPCLKGE
jgi:hypothetical protein